MPSERQIARAIAFEARREAHNVARRRELHPCPTCRSSGAIRRSFGFAYPNDPRSEAYAILPCRTCGGDGVRPKHGPILPLGHRERAAEWHERYEVAFD